jgi:hypothetical protein
VSRRPLKGPAEARGTPPRGRAWLRARRVRSHAVGFTLRGKSPRSPDLARGDRQWRLGQAIVPQPPQDRMPVSGWPTEARRHLMSPGPTEEPRSAARGWRITTTATRSWRPPLGTGQRLPPRGRRAAGDGWHPPRNPPRRRQDVSVAIGVGAWASHGQGEGPPRERWGRKNPRPGDARGILGKVTSAFRPESLSGGRRVR